MSRFIHNWDGKTPYVLVTIIRVSGHAAAKPGDKAIVTSGGDIIGSIGGGCLRGAVVKAARMAIETGEPQFIRTVPKDKIDEVPEEEDIKTYPSACPSRGEVEVFLEPVKPKPVLVVFGETELAHTLVAFGRALGFKAVHGLSETDGGSAGTESFDLDSLSGESNLKADYIVVATQGVKDKITLEASLKSSCPHVFFVASVKKANFWRERLGEAGMTDREMLKLISPAGLHIRAESPAEIALSILAQIVQIKNEKQEQSVESNGGTSERK
ncbi:XdhC family protein [Emcibacter sp.]|uniref:XdhC family protein n=1 Tax=Emcibacter sp. TaxID=1979954 RepID=UPI002AA82A59|nr:XdhC family protein [Emcibacter sp.]